MWFYDRGYPVLQAANTPNREPTRRKTMGDRYILAVKCNKCGFEEKDVYYAPTCFFVGWKCPKCENVIDLEKYTGISYEEASNSGELSYLIERLDGKDRRRNTAGPQRDIPSG